MEKAIAIRPQPGPQEDFLASSADIVIYGGAAGSGKSWAVLLEPLRHITTLKGFDVVFFRRNTTHIRNPGGLWDASFKVYPLAKGVPNASTLEWRWKDGGKIKMGHLEHETSVLDWQGAEIALLIFDELTHFTMTQFFYMMSRNRSMCGVRPYIRATTNPDADSWVADLIKWWIDQDTGFPIQERSGIVRWFVRMGDALHWGDSRQEVFDRMKNPDLPDDDENQPRPKSLTFIPAKLSDNKELTKNDPEYRANLMALNRVERERLLGGNWKIRPSSGLYFKRTDAARVTVMPAGITSFVRYWDLAATEVSGTNPDPDWTSGTLLAKHKDGRFTILDIVRVRKRSSEVRKLVLETAKKDGRKVRIGLSQDPGQAGKEQVQSYVTMLVGYVVTVMRESGDKIQRAEPFSSQWQIGNVDYMAGHWNEPMLDEFEAFPEGSHDDQVDSTSGAFTISMSRVSVAPATGGERVYA